MRPSGYPAAPSFLLVRVAHSARSAPWQRHSGWLLLTVWSFVGFVGGSLLHGAGVGAGRTRAPARARIYRGGLIGLLHVE
jgi:hypothetical protein